MLDPTGPSMLSASIWNSRSWLLLRWVSLSSTLLLTGLNKLERDLKLQRVQEESPSWISRRTGLSWVWQHQTVTSSVSWPRSPQCVQRVTTTQPCCHPWLRSRWSTVSRTTWSWLRPLWMWSPHSWPWATIISLPESIAPSGTTGGDSPAWRGNSRLSVKYARGTISGLSSRLSWMTSGLLSSLTARSLCIRSKTHRGMTEDSLKTIKINHSHILLSLTHSSTW